MAIKVWQTDLKKRYVWVDEPWQPWTNTVAYRPLTNTTTVNDQSWNGYNLTQTGGSFVTLDWVDCFYNGWADTGYFTLSSAPLIPSGSADRTILFWVNPIEYSTSYPRTIFSYWASSSNAKVSFGISISGNYNFTTYSRTATMWPISTNTWALLAVVIVNNNWTLYINGSEVGTVSTFATSAVSTYPLRIMRNNTTNSSTDQVRGYISEVIIEDKAWATMDIAGYFNDNRAKYWL